MHVLSSNKKHDTALRSKMAVFTTPRPPNSSSFIIILLGDSKMKDGSNSTASGAVISLSKWAVSRQWAVRGDFQLCWEAVCCDWFKYTADICTGPDNANTHVRQEMTLVCAENAPPRTPTTLPLYAHVGAGEEENIQPTDLEQRGRTYTHTHQRLL